jgi:hypothetical protein
MFYVVQINYLSFGGLSFLSVARTRRRGGKETFCVCSLFLEIYCYYTYIIPAELREYAREKKYK